MNLLVLAFVALLSLVPAPSFAAPPSEEEYFGALRRSNEQQEQFKAKPRLPHMVDTEPYFWAHEDLPPGRHRKVAVLIHGLTSSPAKFLALAQELYARDVDVVGVRLEGHGTRPRDLVGARASQWQQDVYIGMKAAAEFAAALSPKSDYELAVVGHSLGGALTLNSLLNPQLQGSNVLSRVKKIVLLAPALELTDPVPAEKCPEWMRLLDRPLLGKLPRAFYPAQTRPERTPDGYDSDADRGAVCHLQSVIQANADGSGEILSRIGQNGVKTLVVYTPTDARVKVERIRQLISALPGAQKLELPGTVAHDDVPKAPGVATLVADFIGGPKK